MHKRMTVREVETALKASSWLRSWDYVRDDHFAKHVLVEVVTLKDAEAFLAELDRENAEVTSPPFRWGCTKAKLVREYLADGFWCQTPDRIRSAIANNRRTCCSCHETGSFATRQLA